MLADRLGSPLEVVETATGSVVARYTYDSFGQRSQTGTLAQRYGFTGREHDAESGLIHFRARAYDPATGQFLQRDPIGFAAGDLNLYAYVWNDPYTWTDPSGLSVDGAMTMGRQGALGAAVMPTITRGLGVAVASILTALTVDWWVTQAETPEENPPRPVPVPVPAVPTEANEENCQPEGGNGNNGPPESGNGPPESPWQLLKKVLAIAMNIGVSEDPVTGKYEPDHSIPFEQHAARPRQDETESVDPDHRQPATDGDGNDKPSGNC